VHSIEQRRKVPHNRLVVSLNADSPANGTERCLSARQYLQGCWWISYWTGSLWVSAACVLPIQPSVPWTRVDSFITYFCLLTLVCECASCCFLESVLTFGSYEMYKRTMLEKFPKVKPIFLYALSAVLGDLTGSGWLCPSEVIKQQTQAGMYRSSGEALRGIWQKKGLVGLYEGYFGGIARDVPFRVAQLTSYELTKNLYLRIKGQRLEKERQAKGRRVKKGLTLAPLALAPIEAAVCGAIAGSFSAAITAPLDRFKTLLMTDSAAYGGSVASCAAKIWREEGLAGFATGVVPRVIYIAPSVALFFIVYEQVQQRLDHWKPSTATS
jgi:solute carrier family 25 S-adenosylmethionine transporter 26